MTNLDTHAGGYWQGDENEQIREDGEDPTTHTELILDVG